MIQPPRREVMLRIAICDDISDHLQTAAEMVKTHMDSAQEKYEIQTFQNADQLLSETKLNAYQPDIAILDIEMDGESGISLAQKLNALVPLCRIIFLTSYIDYAPDVYETEHVWFVVKKRAQEHFPLALQKAVASMKESAASAPAIIIKNKGVTTAVPLDRILYLSKVDRKAYVYCTDGVYTDTRRPALLIPDHLKDQFIQCHQGYWINVNMIQELDHDEFILKDGTRIPISRTFRTDARRQFFQLYRI